MAKNNKADMSCARVKKYTASDVSKAERHNERKNETYENMNVIEERIPFNVHFKKPFAPTYMEQLKQMETNGLVSLRGLRKDATLFNEIVIDVNTMYFERNGGYEYAITNGSSTSLCPKKLTANKFIKISPLEILHTGIANQNPILVIISPIQERIKQKFIFLLPTLPSNSYYNN